MYVHNDLISDFSIFGIQIGIFTDMIFKFMTSEATSKFWKHHILFFIISIKICITSGNYVCMRIFDAASSRPYPSGQPWEAVT